MNKLRDFQMEKIMFQKKHISKLAYLKKHEARITI